MGERVGVANPLQTNRFAGADLRRAETDTIDALMLARFGLRRRPEPMHVDDALTATWRELVRFRTRVEQDQGDRVRPLHRQIHLAFPELTTVLVNLGTQRVTTLLQAFPTARRIAEASIETHAELRCGGRRPGNANAAQLVERARVTVGPHQGESHADLVHALCADIEQSWPRIGDLDEHLAGAVAGSKLVHLLVKNPGIGKQSATRLIGELGDPARFESGKALAAHVGVVPAVSRAGIRQSHSAGTCSIGHAKLSTGIGMTGLAARRPEEGRSGGSPSLSELQQRSPRSR